MSVQAITWALKQKTGSPSAKSILLALANYAGPDGDCYPSQERLSDDTEQSVDSVQRRLRELEAGGFIFRQHRQGKRGYRRSDEFVVLMDDACRARAAAMGWAPDVGLEARSTSIRPRDIETNTAECGEGDEANPTPQSAPSNTANEALPKPQLCGTEPKQEPKQEPSPYPPPGEGEVDLKTRWQAFVDGWGFTDPTDLPAPARRVFARLAIDEQIAAVAGGRRYRSHCRLNDRKAKHARSWLNDRGWEAGAPKPADPNAPRLVFIEAGSPQAAAWARHVFETTGRKMFMTEMNAPGGGRKIGRLVESEWPPRRDPGQGEDQLLSFPDLIATEERACP